MGNCVGRDMGSLRGPDDRHPVAPATHRGLQVGPVPYFTIRSIISTTFTNTLITSAMIHPVADEFAGGGAE